MKVLKFGGTSVGSSERIKEVARLIHNDEKQVVVLSAMSGTTNALVQIAEALYSKKNSKANQLISQLEKKYKQVVSELFSDAEFKKEGLALIDSHFNYIKSFTQDLFTIHEERAILAQGELISTALLHLYLQEQKIDSILLPALNFMRIDTNGEPDNYYIKENLERELEKYPDKSATGGLFITQGYICRNLYGEVDNLKRGGSDYSASLIGVAINAEEIQIWTDISGFHNNDPRYVENTYPIERLSFDEAAELAYFGAKILHPSSVQPAKLANIPVRLKNTIKPEDPGTLISGEANGKGLKAVAAKDGITAIKIKSGRMLLAYGFLRKVFEVFERFKTPIDMITTSEVAVSVTIDDTTYLTAIMEELKYYGAVEIDSDQTIICVVGENLIEQKGMINKVLEALKHFNLRMISYGGSRHSISILVNAQDKKEALNSLNGIFST
ncbi:MAG: aspartate kinase [Ignavibacteriaceae bacterium]|nr:aspartate kinase [Ignavibacteriaceae bacterium]